MTNLLTHLTSSSPKNGEFYIFAIDGRGGSGKTKLAAYLQTLMPRFVLLNGDDYFEPTDIDLAWGDFNEARFTGDVIEPLQHGREFRNQPYVWATSSLAPAETLIVDQGVCLERCFSFAMPLAWDLKIWVETPRNICLERGLQRESMPPERVLKVWSDIWQPREDAYIERVQPLHSADIVLDGTVAFDQQVG